MIQCAEKIIRITCEGKDMMPLLEIKELQGQLKELSIEGYDKLKRAILEEGFAFPIEVAVIDGKPYGILDGHQRLRTIRRMIAKEGYTLPGGKLPVCFTQCRDREQAGRLILHAISQYAKIQDEGLYSFAYDFKIDPKSLVDDFDIPDFDTERFLDGYFGDALAPATKKASEAASEYAGGLIYRPTLNKEPSCIFASIRKWRVSTKEAELAVLKEFMEKGDKGAAGFIAEEITALTRGMLKNLNGWAVTNPPIGTSPARGQEHFSSIVARETANRLGVRHLEAFESGARKTRKEREHAGDWTYPPKLAAPNGAGDRFLLIDDVATTGTTIEQCAGLLAELGTVFPIVWIYKEAME